MVKHIWSVLCQEIIIDKETNQISYINALEEAATNLLPSKFPVIKLGVYLSQSPLDVYKMKISLRDPNNSVRELLVTDDYKLQTVRNRLNFVLYGVDFFVPGIHYFLIEIKTDSKWVSLDEVPFEIKLLEKAVMESVKR